MLQAERHAAIGNGAGIRSENAGLAATEDTLDDAGVDFVKVESECHPISFIMHLLSSVAALCLAGTAVDALPPKHTRKRKVSPAGL